MGYKVNRKDGIRTLFNGKHYPNGSSIGPDAFRKTPQVWKALLAEGAIISDEPEPVKVEVEEKPQELPEPVVKVEPVKKTTRKRKVEK